MAGSLTLGDLLAALGDVITSAPDVDIAVSGVANDSRRVTAGDAFVCVPGLVTDGHAFAGAAVEAGASVIVAERPLDIGAPVVVVADARIALARAAAAHFGYPANDLTILGVTGTNGKTTTAYLLASIIAADSKVPGLIGTIEVRIGSEARKGVRTTPESLDLQSLLADMRDGGVTHVAMEVTSHALAMHRVEGVGFAAAAFTNLSQDHLDFHATMDEYFEAKRSLFTPGRTEIAVVNVDDASGRRIADQAEIRVLTFGIASDAHVRAVDLRTGPWGSEFVVAVDGPNVPKGELKLKSALVGDFNVSNCLAAAATALAAGFPAESIESGLAALRSVPGRFEAIDSGQPFAVVVDYSHTPDSLANALREARRMADRMGGRVIVAFGCGGDRDRAKRPLMGAAAATAADIVVVTSDNPRSEDPRKIIDEILEGVVAQRAEGPDAVLVDRREAIAEALGLAGAGDVVVIAGKGHETGQEFADHTIPFDDRVIARELLADLGWSGTGRGGC